MTKANDFRYINIAVIKQDGCTASKQVWTNDPSKAQEEFDGMIVDAERMRNPVVLALVADPLYPILRYNVSEMRATIIYGGGQ